MARMSVWTVTVSVPAKQTGDGVLVPPPKDTALSFGVTGTAAGTPQPGSVPKAVVVLVSYAGVDWNTIRDGPAGAFSSEDCGAACCPASPFADDGAALPTFCCVAVICGALVPPPPVFAFPGFCALSVQCAHNTAMTTLVSGPKVRAPFDLRNHPCSRHRT